MKITKAYEDYLEAILILEKENNKVSSVDISKFLNVSKAAVSKIIKELVEAGYLIKEEKYSKFELSNSGRIIAEKTFEKHELIRDFLLKIGVSKTNAEHDCCLIEHVVSDETISKIKEFINEN